MATKVRGKTRTSSLPGFVRHSRTGPNKHACRRQSIMPECHRASRPNRSVFRCDSPAPCCALPPRQGCPDGSRLKSVSFRSLEFGTRLRWALKACDSCRRGVAPFRRLGRLSLMSHTASAIATFMLASLSCAPASQRPGCCRILGLACTYHAQGSGAGASALVVAAGAMSYR
jgi:hypothetical protein